MNLAGRHQTLHLAPDALPPGPQAAIVVFCGCI
jgi:hypothetical protein